MSGLCATIEKRHSYNNGATTVSFNVFPTRAAALAHLQDAVRKHVIGRCHQGRQCPCRAEAFVDDGTDGADDPEFDWCDECLPTDETGWACPCEDYSVAVYDDALLTEGALFSVSEYI
jgi:hypothetical protein